MEPLRDSRGLPPQAWAAGPGSLSPVSTRPHLGQSQGPTTAPLHLSLYTPLSRVHRGRHTGWPLPRASKTENSIFKNLVNISKSSKRANCCPKESFIAVPFQIASPPPRARRTSCLPSSDVTFRKDTSKKACGAHPAQQTLKTFCPDGWSLSPHLINISIGLFPFHSSCFPHGPAAHGWPGWHGPGTREGRATTRGPVPPSLPPRAGALC